MLLVFGRSNEFVRRRSQTVRGLLTTDVRSPPFFGGLWSRSVGFCQCLNHHESWFVQCQPDVLCISRAQLVYYVSVAPKQDAAMAPVCAGLH